jgi:elongator complex protein 1
MNEHIDAQVNVNWGSKATQFHGSLGKTAALAQPEATVGSSPDDDGKVRISWRGDAAHFVVSTIDSYGKHNLSEVVGREQPS